jgi:hypothetical protein
VRAVHGMVEAPDAEDVREASAARARLTTAASWIATAGWQNIAGRVTRSADATGTSIMHRAGAQSVPASRPLSDAHLDTV